MDELNRDKDKLTLLAQKWRERNNDITIICISTVQMPYHQVEKIFDLLNKLENFDDKRDSLQKSLTLYFSRYIAEKFTFFPCALESVDRIKEKEKWKRELDELFNKRILNIMSETRHQFWAKTNEELVKIQLFYTTVRKEFDDLEESANSLIKIQREALSFDWPDDDAFNKWKNQFIKQISGEDEEEDAKVTVTLVISNEDMEDPQIKVSLQVIEDDTSLSDLMAMYSEDEE